MYRKRKNWCICWNWSTLYTL